jgi:hypothetical protein
MALPVRGGKVVRASQSPLSRNDHNFGYADTALVRCQVVQAGGNIGLMR